MTTSMPIPTQPDWKAMAAEVDALSVPATPDRLDVTPLPEVLLFGLSDGDPHPALGVLGGVRLDLYVLAGCIDGGACERDVIKEALVMAGRRLDVALELFGRVRRAARLSVGKDGAS